MSAQEAKIEMMESSASIRASKPTCAFFHCIPAPSATIAYAATTQGTSQQDKGNEKTEASQTKKRAEDVILEAIATVNREAALKRAQRRSAMQFAHTLPAWLAAPPPPPSTSTSKQRRSGPTSSIETSGSAREQESGRRINQREGGKNVDKKTMQNFSQ